MPTTCVTRSCMHAHCNRDVILFIPTALQYKHCWTNSIYRCFNLTTRRVITSRHIVFDEHTFPFRNEPAAVSAPASPTVHRPTAEVVILQTANQPAQESIPSSTASANASPASGAPPIPSSSSEHSPFVTPSVAQPGSNLGSTSLVLPPGSAALPSPSAIAVPQHPMATRAHASIHKPNPRYVLATEVPSARAPISPLPSSVRVMLQDPNWHAAMEHEFRAL